MEQIQNHATFSFENGKYLASVINDSVVTYDKIIEETKTVPVKVAYKTKKCLYFTCLFIKSHYIINSFQYLLLLDKISIKKYLLPYHVTNDKLKKVLY